MTLISTGQSQSGTDLLNARSSFNHHCPGNHVMQGFLAVSECGHDETDVADHGRDDLAEVASRGTGKGDAVAEIICHSETQQMLADSPLPWRTGKQRLI